MKVKIIFLLSTLILLSGEVVTQCETWLGPPKNDAAESSYVIYRDFVKMQDYEGAFAEWKKVYDVAPAADGRRTYVFKDGIAIYKNRFEKATEADKKEELRAEILDLYDQCAECVGEQAISFKNCNTPECVKTQQGWVLSEKAYDMFYFLQSPYMETLEVLEEAVTLAGDNTIYTTFVPYATVVVYLFVEEEMTKEDARAVHARLNEIADHNIQNNEQLGVYYQQAKDAMNAKFAEIEDFIFDCEYFKNKLVPEYKADPENVDLVRMVYNKLLSKGCDKGEGIMVELQTKYETYAAQENARRVAEFEENNPQVVAKRLYDEGDFPGAIEKYEEAIEKADNDDDKAQYHFAIASIQFRKLSQYASARTSAYKAAELREGWGRPYLLIGDMYGTTSSSCGSNAYERGLAVLAALDKYSYAKSIDPEVEDEANRSIARYSQYIPPQDDVFMRGKKRGDRESVPCWIGETVALRYN